MLSSTCRSCNGSGHCIINNWNNRMRLRSDQVSLRLVLSLLLFTISCLLFLLPVHGSLHGCTNEITSISAYHTAVQSSSSLLSSSLDGPKGKQQQQQRQRQQQLQQQQQQQQQSLLLFQSSGTNSPRKPTNDDLKNKKMHRYQFLSIKKLQSKVYMAGSDNNNNNNNSNNNSYGAFQKILSRFVSPVIDDPYLPLSDVASAQIIAPTLQLVWIIINGGPRPSWCNPYYYYSSISSTTSTTTDFTSFISRGTGSLIAPTLIHGAALATCWLLGAVAAESYKRESISPRKRKVIIDSKTNDETSFIQQQVTDTTSTTSTTTTSKIQIQKWDYTLVLISLFRAGSFAIGLLLIATQLDLLVEYNGKYIQYGDSDEINLRLFIAITEVVNDIFFEIIVLVSFRLYLAFQTTQQQE